MKKLYRFFSILISRGISKKVYTTKSSSRFSKITGKATSFENVSQFCIK